VGPRAGLDVREKSLPHQDFFINSVILRAYVQFTQLTENLQISHTSYSLQSLFSPHSRDRIGYSSHTNTVLLPAMIITRCRVTTYSDPC
jgi:hypothetical protein